MMQRLQSMSISKLPLFGIIALSSLTFVIQGKKQNVHALRENGTLTSITPARSKQGMNNDIPQSQEVHHDSFIGFTAFAESNQIVHAGDIVVFDGIEINEGEFYDVTTNIFTCPFTGVYFISATVKGLGTFGVYIMKESDILADLYSYVQRQPPEMIVSHSITAMCSAGERIWVENGFNYTNLNGEPGIPHTTFTIMLMNDQSRRSLLHNTFDGFSVYGADQSYSTGDHIAFGDVLVNEGNHYDPDLNVFVCPVEGMYYVMTTFSQGASLMRIMLGVEKAPYIILYSEQPQAYINELSNSRLVYCLQGEEISVKATGDGLLTGGTQTSFSVMLLQEQADKQHSSFVGFTAWKTISQTYNTGDVIMFDGVMINEGDGFDSSVSSFICPVDGIYYVSVNFKKMDLNDINLRVMYQTRPILQTQETTENAYPGRTLSNSCVVSCNTGEEIKVVASGDGSVYGDISTFDTTFTIFLMYQK